MKIIEIINVEKCGECPFCVYDITSTYCNKTGELIIDENKINKNCSFIIKEKKVKKINNCKYLNDINCCELTKNWMRTFDSLGEPLDEYDYEACPGKKECRFKDMIKEGKIK